MGQIKGEKPRLNFVYDFAPKEDEGPETIRQLRLICHPEVKRKGLESGTSKGREAICRKTKKPMFGKQTFAMPGGDNETQRGL